MIGVINPNSTQTLARQMEYAGNATYQLMPGEPFPSETPVPTPVPGGGPPADGGDGGDGDSGGSGGGGLSAGAIAGISIGAAAVLILGAALVYLCGRRGGFDKAYRKSAPPAAAVVGGGAPGSLGMVEANYANAAGVGAGLGVAAGGYKSPGQGTVSTFDARNSVYAGAGGYPYSGTTPSPVPPGGQPAPAYGFVPAGQHGHEGYAGGMYP
jgi:hypothetical protein